MPSPLGRLTAVGFLIVALAACAGTGSNAPAVSDAWARPGPAGGDSAAYLVISGGGAADVLMSASSPDAKQVTLHTSSTDASGMTGMHPMASLAVAAVCTIRFEPGQIHLMLSGLTRAIAVGDTIELDVLFQRAGTVVVRAEIRGA